MGKPARNALKGYNYQQSVFMLLLAIMDTQRVFRKIIVEALDTKNFDDIYFEYAANKDSPAVSYRVQVKNYPDTSLDKIQITDTFVTINGNENEFLPTDNNIVVINSELIETNDVFCGLPCVMTKGIIFIPLTPTMIASLLDDMFETESRELQIIHMADKITSDAKFTISEKELPALISLSTDLDEDTILLRDIPTSFEKGILYIEGKPGVGKSHYVKEIVEKYPDAVLYRFWTGSQDPDKNRRIQFDTFIAELGMQFFHSPKKVLVDDLISCIKNSNTLLIIDGLDHVENYNPQQLDLFIDFIGRIADTAVIVLSRPLQHALSWEKEQLLDWNFEETRVYLALRHQISDYPTQHAIFDISRGYPIITFYLAEEFKLSGNLCYSSPIAGINEYYDTLFIDNEKPSSAMSVFASGNCFFTRNELQSFFEDPEMKDVIFDFIDSHPYLFKIIKNRVSLIHDSLNTYLRTRIANYTKRQEKTVSIIKSSVLQGSIEYMARLDAFCFDDDFIDTLLKRYSQASYFKELVLSTCDYDSVYAFYVYLHRMLETRMDALDIYGHYSFSLLYQITTRNNLIGYDSLVFQVLKYMNTHGGIEDHIFSSEYIWQVYLACCGLGENTKQYLVNNHMGDNQFCELIRSLRADTAFYDKLKTGVNYSTLIQQLEKEDNILQRGDVLVDYLVRLWIHGSPSDPFYSSFCQFVDNQNASCPDIQLAMHKYGFDEFWLSYKLKSAVYQLYELGALDDKNPFRGCTLCELILQNVHKGSFEVASLVASYIKLANFEKRDIDINSVALWWTMYYARKDYSVYTIDDALITLENKGLIEWKKSIEILSSILTQSEKGVSHLLTSYVRKKGPVFFGTLNEFGYLSDNRYSIDFWAFPTEFYELIREDDIMNHLSNLIRQYHRTQNIDEHYLRSVVFSSHVGRILQVLSFLDFTVTDPSPEVARVLDQYSVKYIRERAPEQTSEYVPLQRGSIQEEDFGYIAENNIPYLEIARYADGWQSCLPLVSVFSLYPKESIQKDYLEIIHTAMFTRVSDNAYVGNWYRLIGNIPVFLHMYEIEVDWEKVSSILFDFLELSLITS